MKNNIWIRNSLMLFLALLLVPSFASCAKKEKKVEKIVVKKEKGTRVEGMLINKKPFESHAIYPGVFKEWDSFTISGEFSGTIEYMPYEVGSFIKKGDTLVRINTSLLRAQIKQAKAGLNIAKINLERTKKLFAKNLTTQAQLDNTQFQVNNAQAQLDILHVNLRKSVIRSPFNGYIVQKMKKKGELAAPGAPIVSVVQLNPIKFILPVPERDINKVSVGNVMHIKLEATGQMFRGIVYKISKMSNPSTHTIEVEIEVENKKTFDNEFLLKPGMLAKAYLLTERRLSGMVIPLDSIVKTEDGNYIFIQNENKAKRIKVNIVSTSNNNALIESKELKGGETLIIKGIYELINGSRVEVVKVDKNEYKQTFKVIQFQCKDKKVNEGEKLTYIRKLLKSEGIEVLDLFRSEFAYNLAYKGELPKFLSKCIQN